MKPPELQDGWGKNDEIKSTSNNGGWGESDSPVKQTGGGSGWGAGSPAKDVTPPKPCLINKPPVEATVDEKNDPRMKPKRRISMAGKILKMTMTPKVFSLNISYII